MAAGAAGVMDVLLEGTCRSMLFAASHARGDPGRGSVWGRDLVAPDQRLHFMQGVCGSHEHLAVRSTEGSFPKDGCRIDVMPFVVRMEGGHGGRPETEENRMTKVVAIMSMSLDGYVADLDDGVAEVFDWYFTSGGVEVPHRRFGPHDVHHVRVERRARSWSHVRAGRRAHRSTDLRGRPRLGREPRVGTGLRPDPPDPRRMAAARVDGPLRDRWRRERREPGQGRRRR